MKIQLSLLDKVFVGLQGVLDTCVTQTKTPSQPNPAADVAEAKLTPTEQRESIGLMRVNHAGEIAAQGLYIGQAITARKDELSQQMRAAANEEIDHLIWCQQRLTELGSQSSRLSILWYMGALTIGTVAGIAGDRWSLGFLMETEYQVMRHLESHQQRLAPNDLKSRKIVAQMLKDEAKHADHAKLVGAANLPTWLQKLMRGTSKIMTTVAYWV